MAGENLVIVESPAKAKTINKYLGGGYKVLASFGHIRDLPPKDGSVRPDEDFAMDWALGDRSKKHVDEITKAAKDAGRVFLATDPDREGEAISWHVQEVLKAKRGLKNLDFQRITFNEITKSAVLKAIAEPRPLNEDLIEAYLARRALDYLVGFTLSPVLWRKLPGSRSAGRVQSVALRLICEREAEIEVFRADEYWTIEAVFTTDDGQTLPARLTHLDGKKLGKLAIGTQAEATAIVDRLLAAAFHVADVEAKQVRRNPAPPFTTSTLQQEASRKLGLGATATMRSAQKLYEGVPIQGETVGLITYMRTDGLQLAQEAVAQTRSVIGSQFGDRYVPASPRFYKSKQKNAQEAHEAIRPTDLTRTPASLSGHIDGVDLRLYALIWKRTIACQMESAVLDQVAVDIDTGAGDARLRATGSVVKFDGFLKVYEEGRDDRGDDEDTGRRLPQVTAGQPVDRQGVTPEQHFTQPPPRYTEASLVKKMEELGIGRPSTYASILQVLQDRDYVRLDKRQFHPEDRGRLVTTFLSSFFSRYVQYDFTAQLEEQLDDVSGGRMDWKTVLRQFWDAFSAAIGETKDLTITQVIDALDAELGPHFFRPRGENDDPRLCPSCKEGRLGLRLSRTGAFIGCSNYPDCRYTRPLEVPGEDGDGAGGTEFPRVLGMDPETILPVSARKGPYGFYVQLGPAEGEEADKTVKPKRTSIPKGLSPADIDLDTALALLSLPRDVGSHPETGKPIKAGIGRFGPYLQHDGAYKSLPAGDDVLTVGINRAVDLLATARKGGGATPLRVVGNHPRDEAAIGVYSGRYGPYVKHGKVMASLPKGTDVEAVTLEEAIALLDAKAAKSGKPAAKTKAKAPKATKATGEAATATGTGKAKSTKTAAKKTTSQSTATKKTTATKPKAAKATVAKGRSSKATTAAEAAESDGD